MTRIRSLRRSDNYLLADLNDALRPVPRRHVLGVAWRWRHECAAIGGGATLIALFAHLLGNKLTLVSLAAVPGAVGLLPAPRQWFIARAWWLVTPHRLRTGFLEARIQSRRGRVPFILTTSIELFGERVRVWCPAGISASDLDAARGILRTACWAADVRVLRDERYAHLITVDVIRRQSSMQAASDGGGPITDLNAWRDTG